MKILVVKISALGDVVHALPAALYLRNRCPKAQIDWLVEEVFAPLLEGLPYIDTVLPLNSREIREKKSCGELKRMWQIVRRIRQTGYDYIFDLQGNTKSAFFTLISGAPRRFGFDRGGVREWPNLLATNCKVPLDGAFHIADRSLTVVAAAFPGGETPAFAECLRPQPEALAFVKKWLADHGTASRRIVVCHAGTTWKTKLWAPEHWQELLLRLRGERQTAIVLTWGNRQERELAVSLREGSGDEVLLWPGGDLPKLAALLSLAALVVGGDTGPVHIAAALGTPTVSIYRATDADRNGPAGDQHVLLQCPLDCSPCLSKGCDRDRECSLAIPVSEVEKGVAKLLGSG
ncbi:MAG: lipopolysaccharide heptosyltransferase I [Deltaproteobacteria bacterium]|nr:lipopolysaccharide heptosyltransferase I [Deltaproteobacteria bacterium]